MTRVWSQAIVFIYSKCKNGVRIYEKVERNVYSAKTEHSLRMSGALFR